MADSDAQIARRSAIIGVSTLLLVAMIIVVMVGARNKYSFKDDIEDNKKNHVASTMKAIRTICQPTDYKKECEESLRFLSMST